MDSICQTRKKSRDSNSVLVPEEIMIEIPSRLPVKVLLRLRCVCKSWKGMISDAYFIRKHLLHMSSMDYPSRYHILFTDENITRLEAVSLDSLVGSKDYESIPDPPRSILRLEDTQFGSLQPVGSCNGLILLLDRDRGTLLLWNPSIRETKILPDGGLQTHNRMNNVFNFGYDSLANDYKVVEVSKRRASLYSLRTNSWKRIANSPYRLECPSPCCGNAFIWSIDYFRPESLKIFISFDLVKESFQEHPLPIYEGITKIRYYRLGKLHGDVFALYNLTSQIDIWVMKEFGVKESWVKIHTFPPPGKCFPFPLCTWDDEFVLKGHSGVAIYHKKNGASKVILFEDSWTYSAQIYVESLLSPNGEW